MSNDENNVIELSPYFKERVLNSLIAIIGLLIGIIAIIGATYFKEINDIVVFLAIFIGALFIFFSLWRILRIATVELIIDSKKIHYRDRFIWKHINWSEVISVGQKNDLDSKKQIEILKKIKALLIMTNDGLKYFDMSIYSLDHSLETINKITELRAKELLIEEDSNE